MATTKLLNCVYTSEDESKTYLTGLQLFLDANSYEEISGIDNQTPLTWHGHLSIQRNTSEILQNQTCSALTLGVEEYMNQIKIGWDPVIMRFTYIKIDTDWNRSATYGKLTPTTEVSSIYVPP